MDKVKKHEFIEVEYTGVAKEDNITFDTTDEKIAKEKGLHAENMSYGPVIICVGESQIIKGIDNELEGKEAGKSYIIELSPEQGFGRKDAKLVQLIATAKFLKQGIQPAPGIQVNINNTLGVIKTVSGGRTLVDFNHPLASKTLVYNLKINRIITDDKEKLKGYLSLQSGIKDIKVDIEDGCAKISLKDDIPKELKDIWSTKIAEIIPSVKKMEFITDKQEKK